MLNVSYDGIEFQAITVNQYAQELVHTDDGVQPVHLKHSISLTAVLNPATVPWANDANAKLKPQGNANPGVAAGLLQAGQIIPPGLALILLRNRLQVTKKKLKIWYALPDGTINNILESPRPISAAVAKLKDANGVNIAPGDYTVDATDGPHCKVIWTKNETSEGSLIVGLEFETDVPLCADSTSPLIANRFTTSFQPDADNFLTRVITGEAIFRADIMSLLAIDPFALKKSFIVLPPNGYKRVATCQFNSNNTACNYEITDTELGASFPGVVPFGVTRLEVIQTKEYITPTFI